MNTHWYAVYTKPRWEKKVAEVLTRNSIENYCPLNKVLRQWHDRKKVVQEPLFTSYVFVKVEESRFSELRRIGGVLNLVYWLQKPAVIRDEEITMIRKFLDEYTDVQLDTDLPAFLGLYHGRGSRKTKCRSHRQTIKSQKLCIKRP